MNVQFVMNQDGRRAKCHRMIEKECQLRCYGTFHRLHVCVVYSVIPSMLRIWHGTMINALTMRHPADAPQWKTFDDNHTDFSAEPRNLRLGLSTDGINPHSNMSCQHSTWPVILINYNLPPKLCMKRKFLMLTLLISGPQQPRNDIDMYLAPLIDDLKSLWEDGLQVRDSYH